jgi:hypothetical protein
MTFSKTSEVAMSTYEIAYLCLVGVAFITFASVMGLVSTWSQKH